ncbi:MAG: mechanosensitive ion channel family protein [Saprospiraceae bacterium]|nr:mechanosensitive ion channel family protein [Bacteroidia bacterium]NNE14845.1 mechanosensitive ion channel family protein [Saprospiraceae bacterium]NNL90593.1 mechanosensitive ion channel family protein [Saprospiraceae bacterium]
MKNIVIEYGTLIISTFVVVWILSFITRKTLDYFIKKNSALLFSHPTNFIFLKNSTNFIFYSIGLFWIFTKIPYFQSLGTALFASAGILAAVIGFASQKAFANIVGGIFILIFKPFKIGDVIELSNQRRGVVEEITLRHTVIRDYEYKRIVIPNSAISEETIINSSITDEKIRKHIEFGIAYDADIKLAEKIIYDEIVNHPNFIDQRTSEEIEDNVSAVPIKLVSWSDSSIVLRAFVWSENIEKAIDLHWDVLRTIKDKFDSHNIEIPFPHRTIVFKDKKIGLDK